MRQNNKNNRGRGRGRKGPNPLTRSYESNGPDVKVRGTAQHVAEKYLSLARDALSSGDGVAAENYFQHAEHYNRIIMNAQAQQNANREEERRQQITENTAQPSIDSGEKHANGSEAAAVNGATSGEGNVNGQESLGANSETGQEEKQLRSRRRRPQGRNRRDQEENSQPSSVAAEKSAGSAGENPDSLAADPPAFLTAD